MNAQVAHDQQLKAVGAANVAAWAAFDGLPTKTKKDLLATVEAVNAKTTTLASADAAKAREGNGAMARERMAPLILPEARAIGAARMTLVPSADAAKCTVWASMWTHNLETVDSLVALGFRNVKCGEKTSDLKEVANVCYLRWPRSMDHEAGDPLPLWFNACARARRSTRVRAALRSS